MINIISEEKQMEFLNSFEDKVLQSILKEKMRMLFEEDKVLYFVLNPAEDEIAILRDRNNWSTVITKAITILDVKKLERVQASEEKALFLSKAIDICGAKEVKLSLAK